jgi:hypothetical protein
MRLTVVLALLAWLPTVAAQEPAVMPDIMLCYLQPGAWSEAHFAPYVTYRAADAQRPADWFFTAWLMLMYGGAPSGKGYSDGATDARDWTFFLDQLWAPGRNLDALDRVIAAAARELPPPTAPQPVVLMIPYPSTQQHAFAAGSGVGNAVDLAVAAHRQRAAEGFIDEAIRRWQATPRQHLRLWGFYWMNEGIGAADHEIVRQTCAYVHGKGLKMLWIPWFRAPGFEAWRELGFDLAIMQPNFAFQRANPGLALGDENQLSVNARLARVHGMGVEMELNERTLTSAASRWNLTAYLNHGTAELDGTMAGVPRAWYQATDFLRNLADSPRPECRQLYDDVYRFTKGSYQRRGTTLSEGRPVSLLWALGKGSDDGDLRRLTDGSWDTRGDRPERAVRLQGGKDGGGVALRLDLGEARAVTNLRLHLRGATVPEVAHSARSRDGTTWEELRAAVALAYDPHAGPGFQVLTFPPGVTRWLEVTLKWPPDALLELDEVLVPPDGNLLWDSQRRSAGGRVEWALSAPRVVGAVRVAPVSAATVAAADVRLDLERLDPAAGTVGEGWLEWRLPPRLLETLSAGLPGVPDAAVRAEALAAANRALGCPYTLNPAFPATYPDAGGELTDGQLSETGFDDGRTVGWHGTPPTVFIDLGTAAHLDAVRLHGQGGGYAAVQFPTAVEVAVADGQGNWGVLAPGLRPLRFSVDEAAPETQRLGWAEVPLGGTGVTATRLRVRFVQAGGWTMLSEIEVLSQGRNLARQATYQFQPQPTSTAKYADDQGLLTDGSTSSGSGWMGCAGWSSGTPEITLDLQAPTEISLVVVHVVGGGAGGAFFPARLEVSVSGDGSAWTPAGLATCSRAESGTEAIPAAMVLALRAPRQARFVRLTVERHGWAMLHEVEVY